MRPLLPSLPTSDTEICHPSTAFVVQFDTGSTDLWVQTGGIPINILSTTNVSATETYGRGEASGTIDFAEVTVGSYTIPSQGAVLYLDVLGQSMLTAIATQPS